MDLDGGRLELKGVDQRQESRSGALSAERSTALGPASRAVYGSL